MNPQVTLANWRAAPFNRWAFHHVRELIPTADIPNDPRQIRELATLRFVHEASNVILLGPPGVGKTHLAIALAVAAVEAAHGAYFITAHDLVTDLGTAGTSFTLDLLLATPEPASAALMLAGIAGLLVARRRVRAA